MCLDYLCACQDMLYKLNKYQAAGMDFAITYFKQATEYLAEEERPYDEEYKRKEKERNEKMYKISFPLLKSSKLAKMFNLKPPQYEE
jgi:hypothetical protein